MRLAHLDRPHWVYQIFASDTMEVIYTGVSVNPRVTRARRCHRASFGKATQRLFQEAEDRGACILTRLLSLHDNREDADLALCRLHGSKPALTPKQGKTTPS